MKNSISKRQEKQKELVLKKLKQTPIIQVACQKVGIVRATFYRWKKSDKKFRNEVEIAIDEGINLINEMAESQLISAIKDKNLTSIIFWLKTHHQRYTNKVEITTKDDNKLSKKQQISIKNALVFAQLVQGVNHEKK